MAATTDLPMESKQGVTGAKMRYHKSIKITKLEADFIIANETGDPSKVVIISRGSQYFDVRNMNPCEIDAFVADLIRAEHADEGAQRSLPC